MSILDFPLKPLKRFVWYSSRLSFCFVQLKPPKGMFPSLYFSFCFVQLAYFQVPRYIHHLSAKKKRKEKRARKYIVRN
jgi:hypothetical protein